MADQQPSDARAAVSRGFLDVGGVAVLRPVLVDVRAPRNSRILTRRTTAFQARNGWDTDEELAHAAKQGDAGDLVRDGHEASSLRDTMVFISTHGNAATQAAAIAMALGYQRVRLSTADSLAGALPRRCPPPAPTASSLHNGLATGGAAAEAGGNGRVGLRERARLAVRVVAETLAAAPVPPPGRRQQDALLPLMEYGQAQGAPLVTLVDVRTTSAPRTEDQGGVHLAAGSYPGRLMRPMISSPLHFESRSGRRGGVHSRRQAPSWPQPRHAGLHRCWCCRKGSWVEKRVMVRRSTSAAEASRSRAFPRCRRGSTGRRLRRS